MELCQPSTTPTEGSLMTAQCNSSYLDFSVVGPRHVSADFDGGDITSDGGGLLLRKTEELTGIIRQFAACFTDHRKPELTEHSVQDLIAQRVYALALGYEDLNDHDDLRHDPLLATVVGKDDPTGKTRRRRRDRGKALAGKSTLNRLELTPVGADQDSRYKKITCHTHAVERLLVTLFLQDHRPPPERIVLDLDATDDPIHGHQLGRFFHGYYKSYCYPVVSPKSVTLTERPSPFERGISPAEPAGWLRPYLPPHQEMPHAAGYAPLVPMATAAAAVRLGLHPPRTPPVRRVDHRPSPQRRGAHHHPVGRRHRASGRLEGNGAVRRVRAVGCRRRHPQPRPLDRAGPRLPLVRLPRLGRR